MKGAAGWEGVGAVGWAGVRAEGWGVERVVAMVAGSVEGEGEGWEGVRAVVVEGWVL